MDLAQLRRDFARNVAIGIFFGGVLLAVSSWSRQIGAISRLQEDVIHLFGWVVMCSPLFMLLSVSFATPRLRWSIVFAFAAVLFARAVDITDEIERFDDLPVFGDGQASNSGVQQLCFAAFGGLLMNVFFVFFDELVSINARAEDRGAQLQELFDHMPSACCSHDRDGNILTWNHAAELTYGYTEKEVVGRSIYDLLVTEDLLPRTQRAMAKVFSGGNVERAEWRDRDKAGNVGWRIGSIFPVTRRDGLVHAAVTMGIDITDRKKAELALADSEERFRRAFEDGPLGVVLIGLDGRFLHANETFCRMMGYKESELIGKTMLDTTHPDDHEVACRQLTTVYAESNANPFVEARAVRKDGSAFWARARASAIRGDDGQARYALGTVEDISERREAKVALKESEERFRRVFDDGPMGMAFLNADQQFTRVNRALCEMLGYGDEALVGRRIQAITHPDDEERVRVAMSRAHHYTSPVPPIETRFLCKERKDVWARLTVAQLQDGADKPVLYLALIENVSSRKAAEENLESERRLLRRMLNLQERERQSITYDLHDGLIQYVVAAQMQLQACEAKLDENSEAVRDKLHMVAKHLEDAACEGRRVVSGLRHPIIDEAGIAAAIEHLASEANRNSGPRLTFTHSVSRQRFAPALESALFRIAQEAISNCRQHSQAIHGIARLETRGTTIEFKLADDGMGFDRSKVSPERFGLRGIEERARLLGGNATIESDPGKGTRIRVVLPTDGAVAATKQSTGASIASPT